MSPGLRSRPSLSVTMDVVRPIVTGTPQPGCVAGITVPAFVERWNFGTHYRLDDARVPAFVERRSTRRFARVAGITVPAFVERRLQPIPREGASSARGVAGITVPAFVERQDAPRRTGRWTGPEPPGVAGITVPAFVERRYPVPPHGGPRLHDTRRSVLVGARRIDSMTTVPVTPEGRGWRRNRRR